jgi:hypothetical protein
MRRIAEASGFHTHRGLVLDFGVGKEQGALRALLFGLAGLPQGSAPEAREQKVVDLVATQVVRSEQVAFLRNLLDLPQTEEWRALYDAMDNAARNRGAREVASALAKRALAQSPTLIIIEDLHWADSQLLGHVGALATAIDGPGILAMTWRVDGDPIDARWRASCRETPFSMIGCEGTRLLVSPAILWTPRSVSPSPASSARAATRFFSSSYCVTPRKEPPTPFRRRSKALCWPAWTDFRPRIARRSKPRP